MRRACARARQSLVNAKLRRKSSNEGEETMIRMTGFAAAFAAIALLSGQSAQAQGAYPTQNVKFVVPSPAGSTTDLLARTLAEPRQLPVGGILALVGAPLFLLLLRRAAR